MGGLKNDPVNNPSHYTQHRSGIECIQVTEHMNFCLGNAMKYLWRAGSKGDAIEDLKKAAWYIEREIQRLSTDQQPEDISGDEGKVLREQFPIASVWEDENGNCWTITWLDSFPNITGAVMQAVDAN